jgi:2-polyprenyl-3-methyl-5-hydroxy-6-metoxy-1,4-benzoquinol methylase
MHQVCCDLCRQDNAPELAIIDGTRIVRCSNCGLVYVNPREDLDLALSHEEYYGDGTFLREPSHFNVGSRQAFAANLRSARAYQPSGRLLDVGCGGGFFLDLARQQGYEPYGVELDKDGCAFAANKLSLDVFHGTLLDAKFQEGFFNVVTILNVLEHVDSPIDVLRETLRVLKPGGVVTIVVPNLIFGLPFLRLRELATNICSAKALDRKIKLISVFDIPEHLYLFTPKILRMLLKEAGFETIVVTNAPVIENPGSFGRTVLKRLVRYGAAVMCNLSGGTLLISYSIECIGIKPR